jgi:hypothetical protein
MRFIASEGGGERERERKTGNGRQKIRVCVCGGGGKSLTGGDTQLHFFFCLSSTVFVRSLCRLISLPST